jgi:hypothetical protein
VGPPIELAILARDEKRNWLVPYKHEPDLLEDSKKVSDMEAKMKEAMDDMFKIVKPTSPILGAI